MSRRCPRQGHPQRVPPAAACARARETPPPHSPPRARGTNLCRLGDFCLLVCFVLRCPCNCLLNPDGIIFIADDAQSRKALPWAAQPGLVSLLGPSGRGANSLLRVPARVTAALPAGTGRTGVPPCRRLVGELMAELLCRRKRARLIIQREEGTGSSLLPCRRGAPGRGASPSAARAGGGRGCDNPDPFGAGAGTRCHCSSPCSMLWIQPFSHSLGSLCHWHHLQFPLGMVSGKGTCLSPSGWVLSWVLVLVPPCSGALVSPLTPCPGLQSPPQPRTP